VPRKLSSTNMQCAYRGGPSGAVNAFRADKPRGPRAPQRPHQRPPRGPERQQARLSTRCRPWDALCARLSRFDVTTTSATDAVLDSGQTVAVSSRNGSEGGAAEIGMRADITGNRGSKGLVYDGPGPSPSSIRAEGLLLEEPRASPRSICWCASLSTTYNIDTPLADLFYWGDGKVDDVNLDVGAFSSGWSVWIRAGGNHYAYQQKGALTGNSGSRAETRQLPCRMEIVDTAQGTHVPRHVVTYHWKLNPEFPASIFTFRPAANAKAIELKACYALRRMRTANDVTHKTTCGLAGIAGVFLTTSLSVQAFWFSAGGAARHEYSRRRPAAVFMAAEGGGGFHPGGPGRWPAGRRASGRAA